MSAETPMLTAELNNNGYSNETGNGTWPIPFWLQSALDDEVKIPRFALILLFAFMALFSLLGLCSMLCAWRWGRQESRQDVGQQRQSKPKRGQRLTTYQPINWSVQQEPDHIPNAPQPLQPQQAGHQRTLSSASYATTSNSWVKRASGGNGNPKKDSRQQPQQYATTIPLIRPNEQGVSGGMGEEIRLEEQQPSPEDEEAETRFPEAPREPPQQPEYQDTLPLDPLISSSVMQSGNIVPYGSSPVIHRQPSITRTPGSNRPPSILVTAKPLDIPPPPPPPPAPQSASAKRPRSMITAADVQHQNQVVASSNNVQAGGSRQQQQPPINRSTSQQPPAPIYIENAYYYGRRIPGPGSGHVQRRSGDYSRLYPRG